MKRLFFAAIAALALTIGVSAAIVNHKSKSEPSENQTEMTADAATSTEAGAPTNAATSADASAAPSSNATVDYVIPNITSGSIKLDHFRKIYNLMPSDIHKQAAMAFDDIVNNPRSDFKYAGVRVKHTASTWEFYYKGGSVIVRNATDAELQSIFAR